MKLLLLLAAAAVLFLIGAALQYALTETAQTQRDLLNAVSAGMQIVAVILSAVTLLLLFREQYRTDRNRERQPDLRITLAEWTPFGGTVQRQPGERSTIILMQEAVPPSDPERTRNETRVRFEVLNAGDRSARDLLINVIIPSSVLVDEEHALDVQGGKPRVFPGPDGHCIVAVTAPHIHAKDLSSVTVGLRLPYDLYHFDIDVSISMADAPSVSASFPVSGMLSLTGGSSTS